MPRPIIEVEGLSKRYRLGQINARSLHEEVDRLLQRLSGKAAPADEAEFWALRDVSFQVQPGEVVGIIGRNGAGKSTLLKILSRVTEPTSGQVRIRGRVASLLEVGTGFHPELSGRENIYLNGAILGMSRGEISAKFDEIVAFAEVEQFLDTPVKRYSSGMYVRLAFAVAAHLEPEVLIVDEVLAVGDAEFQQRCIGKMQEVSGHGGRTVLFVSHNMGVIGDLCDRALVLAGGQVVLDSSAREAVRHYLAPKGERDAVVNLSAHPHRSAQMQPCLLAGRLLDRHGRPCASFGISDPWTLELDYDTGGQSSIGIGYGIYTSAGQRVGGFNSCMAQSPPYNVPKRGRAMFNVEKLGLCPGHYFLSLSVGGRQQGELRDKVDSVLPFEVLQNDIYGTGWLLTPEDGVHVVEATCTLTSLEHEAA